MDDIRYSELQFLQALANCSIRLFNPCDEKQSKTVGLSSTMYTELVITLMEDMCVRFDRDEMQLVVARLRGELSSHVSSPQGLHSWQWDNPRQGLREILVGQSLQEIRITYRGLRRIEELRELLKRDRILDHFGVLLDFRYFHADLENAVHRKPDTIVSVLYADMDNFKTINTQSGHSAGDVVMKAYLEVVRDTVGLLGTGYRGVGDETKVIIIGQGHDIASQIAEEIRRAVESMRCEYQGNKLPSVTASIGLATAPPALKTMELENLADQRQQMAKESGKNRVIAI